MNKRTKKLTILLALLLMGVTGMQAQKSPQDCARKDWSAQPSRDR